jgi:VWFA-related protein
MNEARGTRNGERRVRGAAFALLALTIPPIVAAQQQAPPTFRSGVSLVTVDVSVLDKDGKPVQGLQAGDFEIKLNGKVRPVKVATFIEAAAELGPAAAAVVPKRPSVAEGAREGTQVSTNEGVVAAQKQRGEDRVFVLLVDDLSFAPTRGKALFLAARTFLEKLPAIDVVGFATTSGSAAINPTTERTKVRSALNHSAGEASDFQSLTSAGVGDPGDAGGDPDGSVGVYQSLEIAHGNNEVLKQAIADACFGGYRTLPESPVDSTVLEVLFAQNECAAGVNKQWKTIATLTKRATARQVASYVSVIEAMKAATGLRHLVVLSDGLAIGRDASQLTQLARSAAAAGVQVSVLMEERDMSLTDGGRRQLPPAGAGPPPPRTDTGAPQRRLEDNRMFMAGAQLLAEMAGGQFHRIIGDPMPFFDRVRAASSAVYRLGVEPAPDLDTSRIDSVEAKVGRKGVFVHANRHGVAAAGSAIAAFAPPTIDEKLKTAIGQGQSHGAVPLRVATALRRSATDATLDLNINAEVANSVKGPVIAMFGLVKDNEALGAITSGRREIAAPADGGPFVLSVIMPVSAGSYRLRLAVADATGALGALDIPVAATLGEMGPFAASDLMTAWVDAKGLPHLFALEDLPAGTTGLQAILELYAPAGGAAGVIDALKNDVQVEFSLTKVGETDPIDERNVVPQLSAGVLRALVEFPTADLAPGTYRLRAKVETGGKLAGSTIATVKKR